MRQLHVVRGEEEVVRRGRRRPAGPEHLRILHRRAGVLWGLAQGESSSVVLLCPSRRPVPVVITGLSATAP